MDPSLIRIIGNTGKEGKGENQFAQPRGICVDNATKELFIVDCNNHRIQVYHLNSLAYIRQIGKGVQGDAPGSLNYAVGVCLDENNQLFVADTNNHRVVVFNRITGGHVRTIGSQGTARGCLYSPYGVCIDTFTNVLYVADYDNHRVQAFNKDTGEFIRIIGAGFGADNGQMNQPIVVCIDYELDYLLVADYSNNRVIVFDKETGSFVRNIGTGTGPDSLSGPRGLCVCKEVNLLFVADREHHRIQLYDKTTYECLRSIGDVQGINPGQFFRPMEVCVNVEEGVLIVVDGYNHRVQIMEIPELQAEKRRLKALALSKAEAELHGRTVPKPSMLAVCTQLTGQELVLIDPITKALRLRFEHLGPLYDVHVPQSDVPLLLTHLSAIVGQSELKRWSPAPELGITDSAAEVPPASSLADRQADMFLSILESLCPAPEPQLSSASAVDSVSYMLVAPALFALHSLLDRGWRPSSICPAVIRLLAGFLANIGSGIAAEAERSKVLDAIVALLRAGIATSEDVLESVLEAVLGCLDRPVMYLHGDGNTAQSTGLTSCSATFDAGRDSSAVLLAYFEILGAIFCRVGDQPRENVVRHLTPVLSRSSSKVSMAVSPATAGFSTVSVHERRKHSNELRRDVLDCMFGVSFMSNLHESQAARVKPVVNESTRTLTIPLPGAAVTMAATTLPPAVDVPVHAHPAFAMHPHIGAQIAAATAASAAENHTNSIAASPSHPSATTVSSSNAANRKMEGIYVPVGLCPLVRAAYRVRRLRQPHHLTPLSQLRDASSIQDLLSAGTSGSDSVRLESLQVQLFCSASQYFHHLRSNDWGIANAGLSGAALSKRTRGGRNIWRPTEPLAPGDLVDAQDKEKCWFESIVQEIQEDGSIKVHFMGWGSKWDDVISSAELTERLAPLNAKTKNWRADLFQGGLIEIKCNDDPINQKWMWGRITALNVEEAWVEVSYLFSNEPTVVKRAWLFGETICPVGMHTKDKSKAAAALLVKPLKKVEDIIRERTEEAPPGDEAMFFDKADDLDEGLVDADLPSSGAAGTSNKGAFTALNHLAQPPSASEFRSAAKSGGGDPLQITSFVGVAILECLMGELVSVVTELVATNEVEASYMHTDVVYAATGASHRNTERFEVALSLISQIAGTPFRRLLVPYFTRVLIFQCGMRAKLVSGGILSSKLSTVALSGLQDLGPVVQILDRFKAIAAQHNAVVESALGTALSPAALQEITNRITATVDRCGVTQVANDLIELILQQNHLRYELFARFLQADRFGDRSLKLRKILSYLFKTASRKEAARFQALFEGNLMAVELREMDFTPQLNHQRVLCADWALQLVTGVVRLFQTAQSVARLELLNIPQCHLAAERALRREFSALPSRSIQVFAKALALVLDTLLDSSQLPERQPSWKQDTLQSVLEVQKNVMSEELLHFFGPSYEVLLARRLLSANYSSLIVEKSVLDALPTLTRAHKMLIDVAQTAHVAEFGKYLMNKIDSDELPYTPVLNLVLQKRQFSVHILCQHTWHKHAYNPMYAQLSLPAPMQVIQTQFNAYYKASQEASRSNTAGKKLTWCLGAGSVTLTCHLRGGTKVDIVVNEPQAAVLFAFNKGDHSNSKSLAALCSATNLALEELRSVVVSLITVTSQVPLLTVDSSSRGASSSSDDIAELTAASRVRLSDALSQEDFGGNDKYSHNGEDALINYAANFTSHTILGDANACQDWRNQQVDACIVRVLKQAARRAVFSSDKKNSSAAQNKEVLTSSELIEFVSAELSKRVKSANLLLSNKAVLLRADHLASLGFIDKVDLLTNQNSDSASGDSMGDIAVCVGYCYIPSDAVSSAARDELDEHELVGTLEKQAQSRAHSITTGADLYAKLLCVVSQAGEVSSKAPNSASEARDRDGVLAAAQDDEGGDADEDVEGDGGSTADCGESKNEPTTPVPVQSFTPQSREDGIGFEDFSAGLIHFVTSLVPSVAPRSSPAVMPHWERSAIASVDPIDTSARFGNPSLSPLRPMSASKSMGSESKNRDSPGTPSTPPALRWYPRTSPHAAFPISMSPPRGTPARQPPVLLGCTPTAIPSLSFPPLPRSPSKIPAAMHSTQINAQLKAIHERTYASFSALLSQVNTLLYQHSLGRIPRLSTHANAVFPPPDIAAYLAEVSKAFALDSPALSDWSVLHQELFFALPTELVAAVSAKFCAVIDIGSAERFARLTLPSQQWNDKFTVAGQKSQHSTDDGRVGAVSESGNEDSKAQSVEEGEAPYQQVSDDLNISDSIVQISLGEFVLSTFANGTGVVSDAPSEAGMGKFADTMPLFQGQTSVPLLNHAYHSGELSPHTAGNVSKHDKRRSRMRSRPSTASHSRSTPPARRPSAEDRSPHSADALRSLRGDSLSARESAYSDLSASIARLREAERNLYSGEESREIDHAASESVSHTSFVYSEPPYFGSHASSGATSRTSSRSNSHGDFAVAQLMHSIEEQLRAPAPVSRLSWSPAPREESGKDGCTEGDERRALPHRYPISSEFIFKPEQKVFMAPMTERPSTAATFGTPFTAAKQSGSSIFSAEAAGKPVTALPLFTKQGGGESLQDLIGRYFTYFLGQLAAEFLPEADRARVSGKPLDPQVCLAVVRHLLENTAQHVVDLVASDSSTVAESGALHSLTRSLWFLSSSLSPKGLCAPQTAGVATLDGLLKAAFSMLDMNNDGLLTPSDFPALVATVSADKSADIVAEIFDDSCGGPDDADESLVVDITELISLSAKSHNQDFVSFLRSAQNALELPDHQILQLLAQHRWSAEALLDTLFTADHHQLLTQAVTSRSFMHLSDSFADIYARQIAIDSTRVGADWTTPTDCGAASYESASALCEHCQRAACCSELFALRCRHYSCANCWREHINSAVQDQAGHVTCMICTSSSSKIGAGLLGMQVAVAGLDLIAAVASTATVQTYLRNRIRIFMEDFNSVNATKTFTNAKLASITLQCAPRSDGVAGAELLGVSSTVEAMPTSASSPSRSTPTAASTPPPPRARPASSPRSAGTPSGLPPAPAPRIATPTRPMTGTSRNPSGIYQSTLMKKFFDNSGMSVDLSGWGIERAEGHISRYLLETRSYMLAQAAEVEQQLKVMQSTAKFETLTNKQSLLDQYLRAVRLIEHLEQGSNLRSREPTNLRLHTLEEALEALRDTLIVSHIKMRSKWATPDGLSAAVARETLSTMRLRMGQVVRVMESESIAKQLPLRSAHPCAARSSPYDAECRRKYSARSLVVDPVPGTSTSLAVAALVSQQEEPWKLFGDLSGETLTMPVPSALATEQTTAMDKFAECRKLVEKLSSHRTLNQIVLSRHLKALEVLVESGYQTVLFANNICPVLISVIEHNFESFPICHLVCSVLEKLCVLNAPCAQCLIDLNVWRLLTLLFAKRRNDSEFCIAGSRLMTSMLTSSEENKKASFAAIENSSLFEILKRVLKIHQVDFHTCQPLIQAIVHAVDKSYTKESTFMHSGLCEALIACILQFGAFPGMKMQLAVLISRLASGNKFMQDTLISMRVFESLIDVLNDYAVSDPMLIKSTCFAISSLVSRHHPGQTKFATAGGCKAICRALRLSQDLHTLTYILRAVAALAQQNAYVQDFFQLESAVDLLLAKKDEVIALSERSQSFETKSKLNLLLLTCEYALDAVRSPAGRRPVHNATEDAESNADSYSIFDSGAGMRFLDTPGFDDGQMGLEHALRNLPGGATMAGTDDEDRGSGEQADWLV